MTESEVIFYLILIACLIIIFVCGYILGKGKDLEKECEGSFDIVIDDEQELITAFISTEPPLEKVINKNYIVLKVSSRKKEDQGGE